MFTINTSGSTTLYIPTQCLSQAITGASTPVSFINSDTGVVVSGTLINTANTTYNIFTFTLAANDSVTTTGSTFYLPKGEHTMNISGGIYSNYIRVNYDGSSDESVSYNY